MKTNFKFFISIFLILASACYIFPWNLLGINVENTFLDKKYTLGLDLQGGVELDYQVDTTHIEASASGSQDSQNSGIMEGLKKIIDKRVSSLGLSEPNIQTLQYGSDTHILVQIPTESYSDLSEADRQKKQKEDIERAKEVIGKVVNLEFRERRTTTSNEEYEARKTLAKDAKKDLETLSYSVFSQKYHAPIDGIFVKKGEGEIPVEVKISALEKVNPKTFPYVFDMETLNTPVLGQSGAIDTTHVVLRLDEKTGENTYKYSYISVNKEPGDWIPAKNAEGKILDDTYLSAATAFLDPNSLQPKISLSFNADGAKMFGEITSRLIGKPLAIFVGGEMVMNANVNDAILTGQAEITGGYRTLEEAKVVADDIATGIVPAPIYLTSERAIDAKIGATALTQIMIAGLIGLLVIVVFLIAVYRVGGLLAGIALVAYTIFLIALVKFFGVVLTLAAVAGVILSIGLAIDANILIFERIREALDENKSLSQAITIGFKQSWSAIWDSHLTSFVSAFILYAVGVALIKGFGFMLGIGILLSLFTAMWISQVLILFVSHYCKNPKWLVGYSKK